MPAGSEGCVSPSIIVGFSMVMVDFNAMKSVKASRIATTPVALAGPETNFGSGGKKSA
jgi:hypothetical protein